MSVPLKPSAEPSQQEHPPDLNALERRFERMPYKARHVGKTEQSDDAQQGHCVAEYDAPTTGWLGEDRHKGYTQTYPYYESPPE